MAKRNTALLVAALAMAITCGGSNERTSVGPAAGAIGDRRSLSDPTVSQMDVVGMTDAYDINDAGEIVGTMKVGTSVHAALSVGSKIYDLGTIETSGALQSYASGINRLGQVVGVEVTPTETYSFVW